MHLSLYVPTYYSADNRWGFDGHFNYKAFPRGGDFDCCSTGSCPCSTQHFLGVAWNEATKYISTVHCTRHTIIKHARYYTPVTRSRAVNFATGQIWKNQEQQTLIQFNKVGRSIVLLRNCPQYGWGLDRDLITGACPRGVSILKTNPHPVPSLSHTVVGGDIIIVIGALAVIIRCTIVWEIFAYIYFCTNRRCSKLSYSTRCEHDGRVQKNLLHLRLPHLSGYLEAAVDIELVCEREPDDFALMLIFGSLGEFTIGKNNHLWGLKGLKITQ